MTKKITVEEAALAIGYEKRGRFYYSMLYINGYNGHSGLPFGLESVHIFNEEWADGTAYTRKQIMQMYEEYMAETQEEKV
jgi:hypothetical protein